MRTWKKQVSVELTDIPEGRYKIIEYTLSRESGSSYDVWEQMGCPEHMMEEDLNYLHARALPRKEISYCRIAGEYSVIRTLHMHEVCLLRFQLQNQ